MTQDKARFRRSLTGGTHRHAFEVEVPHALGVLLRLLGDGEVCAASWSDLRLGERVVPHMGGARLALRHRGVRAGWSTAISPRRCAGAASPSTRRTACV